MAKQILGDYELPEEGDIIDQVVNRLDKSKEKVKQLKEKTDFLHLLASFGIEVKKNGKGHMAKCPFHADKTPSLSIEPDKKLFHCFGCGAKGDLIEFVKMYKHTDFKGAIEILKGFTGKPVKQAEKKKTLEILFTEEDELEKKNLVMKVTCDYHKQLLKNKKALAYLETRGLKDFELIKRFTIGFSDGTTLLTKLSGKQKDLLKQAGIITARGKEHFAGCIIFPVIPEHRRVGEIYGRSITGKNLAHRYLKGRHEGIFNRKASKVYDEIILTESIIDAVSLIRLGIANVQAIYGTNGFTEEHLKTLKADRVKTIVVAMDNDDAGKAASGELKEKLVLEGFAVKTITPPEVKDWNDYLTGGGTAGELKKLIAAAGIVKQEQETGDFSVKKEKQKYIFDIAGIAYRILGVKKLFVTNLKVNIRAEYEEKQFPDNVDLCSARSRTRYSQTLARIFELEVRRIENDLIRIMDYFEEERDKELELTQGRPEKIELTEEEREAGFAFLKNPDMFDTITRDMTILGYVNEEINKLIVYIAAMSRFMKKPLNVYIQSGSSGGKSALLSTLEQLILPSDIWKATTISAQAFNYVEQQRFLDKVFFMGESIHDEAIEGLVRQMQSEGEISRLVTVKDEKTGEMRAQLIRKKVRMSFMVTSTALHLNPENASRCIILTADESKTQTHKVQQRLGFNHNFEGVIINPEETKKIIKKHHAAQLLLKKVFVYNPYCNHIKFPAARPSMRRAFEQFLTMIDTICYLRQMQKADVTRTNPATGEEIVCRVCDLTDYRIAYNLFKQGILKNSGFDIPTGTRKLHEAIREMVRDQAKEQNLKVNEVSFIQKNLREYTQLGGEFIKKHIRILVNYEYLEVLGGRRHGTRYAYRLREDRPIEEMDISMITTPDELKKLIEEDEIF